MHNVLSADGTSLFGAKTGATLFVIALSFIIITPNVAICKFFQTTESKNLQTALLMCYDNINTISKEN